MKLCDLKAPFPKKDVEWRIQRSGLTNNSPWGMVLAYITNRAIMERLDAVCGQENWTNDYAVAPDGGVLCGIGIKCGDEWVWKWDGAPNTDIESVKGGLSGSMKRAGSQWGVGRYLYNLETGWANFVKNGKYRAKIEGNFYNWNPPSLPAWALPKKEEPQTKDTQDEDSLATAAQKKEFADLCAAAEKTKQEFADEWGITKQTTYSQAKDIILAASKRYSS